MEKDGGSMSGAAEGEGVIGDEVEGAPHAYAIEDCRTKQESPVSLPMLCWRALEHKHLFPLRTCPKEQQTPETGKVPST